LDRAAMIHEPAQSVSVSLDLLASNLAAPPADHILDSNAPVVGSQRNAKVSQVAYTPEQLQFLQGHLNGNKPPTVSTAD
jgi:hypothetical protein